MRILRYILFGLLLVIVVVAIGGFVVFNKLTRGPLPQHSGTVQIAAASAQADGATTVAGLTAPVEIIRDEYGVPHIYASNMHDLLFAQGYTQAQDRWWQMEFARAVGDGRIQELTGANDEVMGNDVFIRTAGWREAAERNIAEAYDAETVAMMQAFADGVNAYISGKNGGDLALEYSLLGVNGVTIPVRAWTPADSEVWLKAMQWDLGNGLQDQARSEALAAMSAEELLLVEPMYPFDAHPTIINVEDLPISEETLTAPAPSEARVTQGIHTAFAGSVDADVAFAFGRGEGIGSNNWVVSGSKTASGMPLLANDPHLGIQMPSIWYEVGLHCAPVTEACPFDVRGYALPAVPGVVLGHNARIAWGFTNIDPDVIDLFAITVNPDDPLQYEYDGEMRDMTVREEVINFGDGGSVTIQVRETHLGPIINDNALDDNGQPTGFTDEPLAFRWAALDPSQLMRSLFLLNSAGNWEDFREAASYFAAPAQNIVYADVDGNIGYQSPGLVPVRPAANSGRTIQDGSTSETAWLGYIPFDLLPRVLNPERGYIHSANEALAPMEYYTQLAEQLSGEYGDDINVVINDYWDYGFRGQRIVELLEASDEHTIESMQAIQADNKILVAEALAPYLAALTFDEPALNDALDWMLDWDYQANRDSGPAALFSAFWKNVPEAVFNDQYGEIYSVGVSSQTQWAVISLLEQADHELWDNLATDGMVETRDDTLAAAFAAAHAELTETLGADRGQWAWGNLHTAVFVSNPLGLSGISLIEDIVNRSSPAGGWVGAVNATNWNSGSDYELTSLPSFRSVYDLGDLDRSQNHHTTGQSGHPYSDHYADQIPLWASLTYKPMVSTRAAVEAAGVSTLTLQP